MSAIDEITACGNKLDVAIFFGKPYSYEGLMWSVQITFKDEKKGETSKIEVEAKHPIFTEAVDLAWSKVSHIVKRSFGSAALAPSIEAPKIEHKDEIPF